MSLEEVRAFCLSLPSVTEQIQWEDDLVYKIGGKIFAILALEPSHGVCLSFKCTPTDFGELTECEGIRPAPYLARYNWIGLESFRALEGARLTELIRDSYAMVRARLPKKLEYSLDPFQPD